MKPISLALLALCAATALVEAQDESAATSQEPTAPRILGKIPDGTPPAPAPPKRKFVVPAKDVLETKVHQQGGRTVTIRKIKPLPLPPPPVPAPERDPAAEAEFHRQAVEYRENHPGTELLFLSATIFRSKDSQPRSLVRWWPQNGGHSLKFWSSADFALIAGGINSFVDSAGETHAIFMGWGNADIDRMTSLRAAAGLQYVAPVIPDFPQGAATFLFENAQPDADELAAIQSLHDLYNSNLAKLTSAFQGRELARAAREAWLKAHPPQPKDITINWWSTEEPSPKAGRP